MKPKLRKLLQTERRGAHRPHRPGPHPRLARAQKIAQQESLTAILYNDLAAWSADAADAGLQLETHAEGTIAYNTVGANKVFHGYYPAVGTTGYLDPRATYASVTTMVQSIREYSMNKTRRALTDSALTSYFKKAGMTVEVNDKLVTVWTDSPATHCDAIAVACDLGPQIGPIESVEDPKTGGTGIKFELMQANYPSQSMDPDRGKEHGNEPGKIVPGVNKESSRRRGLQRG